MEYINTLKTDRITIVTDKIDAVGANPNSVLRFYAGTKPTIEQAITDQTLLVELDIPVPCAASIVDGVATMNPLTEQLAVTQGDVTFAEILDADGNRLLILDVAEITSDITVETVTVYQGAMIRMDNWSLSDA